MVSVAIFCMPKHAREAASCQSMQEKLPVAMHPEKLPVAGSVGGRFGWRQVRSVAGSLYIGMEC